MSFQYTKAIFFIGDPSKAKPHCDLSGVQKFIRDHPEYAVIIVVENDAQQKEVHEKLKAVQFPQYHPGGLICTWENDQEMLDSLCGDLHFLQSWRVVGNAWYECKSGHISAATLGDPRLECPECKGEVEFLKQDEERCERFAQLLKTACNLMNFDTRSASVLNATTNPTRNVLRNMLALPSPPEHVLEDYVGKGSGKVAFCLASGPSLKRMLPHVKRLQDGAITIAAGRNFKLLREHGIRVDFLFSCEMYGWDCVIFDKLSKQECGDTILCFPPVVAAETVAAWPGKKLCTWDANTAELLDRKVAMMGGNSIAHHMYNFAAEILKCSRVVLVGQDLGYTEPGELTHADGTFHAFPDSVKHEDTHYQAEDWGVCTSDWIGPFTPDNHKQNVWIVGAPKPVGPVLVRTSPSYKNFGSLFEILIHRHKTKTYNACPNGLKIAGAPYLDLGAVASLEDIPV